MRRLDSGQTAARPGSPAPSGAGAGGAPAPWTAAFWVKREADSAGASLFSSLKCALKLEQWHDTHALGFTQFDRFDASFSYKAPIGAWVHLAPGGIKQTFETIPGAVYSVRFALAGNPAGAPETKVMRVEVSPSTPPQSAEFRFSVSGRGFRNMGWEHQTWSFTAQGTATTIEFFSLVPDAYGPVLDDVSVWRS